MHAVAWLVAQRNCRSMHPSCMHDIQAFYSGGLATGAVHMPCSGTTDADATGCVSLVCRAGVQTPHTPPRATAAAAVAAPPCMLTSVPNLPATRWDVLLTPPKTVLQQDQGFHLIAPWVSPGTQHTPSLTHTLDTIHLQRAGRRCCTQQQHGQASCVSDPHLRTPMYVVCEKEATKTKRHCTPSM